MNFDFIKHKETEYLIPTILPDKEKYYFDLLNIENSFTGRLDVMFSNDFFREASQLIINSITLYEKGYFDCAFYSLRQSLEISTTVVYFADDDDENRKSEFRKWVQQERFPQQGQMLNQLQNRKKTFFDIKQKMTSYFDDIEQIKRKLNKYVHKQGFDKFYIHRRNSFRSGLNENTLAKDFELFLKKSIGAIGVFRLTIDPIPLLLNDEAIYKRTTQLMTDSFSDDFLEKYIGLNHIQAYKETELFKSHYEYFIQNEEMSNAVTMLVKDDFYDRKNYDEVYNQKHLLGQHELAAFTLFSFSTKIAQIHCYKGLLFFFSDVKSNNYDKTGFSSEDFNIFDNNQEKFNRQYEKALLSNLKIYDEEYYIEHNEPFSEEEIDFMTIHYTQHAL